MNKKVLNINYKAVLSVPILEPEGMASYQLLAEYEKEYELPYRPVVGDKYQTGTSMLQVKESFYDLDNGILRVVFEPYVITKNKYREVVADFLDWTNTMDDDKYQTTFFVKGKKIK